MTRVSCWRLELARPKIFVSVCSLVTFKINVDQVCNQFQSKWLWCINTVTKINKIESAISL